MHSHVSSCLRGPVSRTRRWWRQARTPRVRTMQKRPEEARPRDPEIRADLVARVRREIAAGTYETPEKLEIALNRLLRRLEEK